MINTLNLKKESSKILFEFIIWVNIIYELSYLLHLFTQVAFTCFALFSWNCLPVKTQQKTRTFADKTSATISPSEKTIFLHNT